MAISFRSSSIMAIPDEERQDKYENDEFIADDIEDEEEQDEEEKANTDDERQKKKKRKNKEEYVLDEDDYELREDNNINIRPSKESQRFKRLKKDRTDTEEESSGMSDKDEFVCGYKGAPLQDSAEGEEQGEEEEDADTSTINPFLTRSTMARAQSILTASPKGGFVTMFLKDQDFGYVERIFVIRFLNELGSQWTIVDENGRLHEITYNMDIHYPKLTRGWSNFRRCYDLDSRKLFVLKFVGNSSFQVMFAKESSSDFRVAKFLNKVALYSPLTTSPLIHFEVRLSKFNCEASHLDLSSEFGNYFCNSGLTKVVLHGPFFQVECNLLVRSKSVKIGSGWKNFCKLHELEERISIIFEVESQKTSVDIKVIYNL